MLTINCCYIRIFASTSMTLTDAQTIIHYYNHVEPFSHVELAQVS